MDNARTSRQRAHPALELRCPLRRGDVVRVNRGLYAGSVGVVQEALTPESDPAWLTGGCRLGVVLGRDRLGPRDVGDPRDNVVDFCRYELSRPPRRRRRTAT